MNQPVELVVFDIAGTTVTDKGEIAAAFQSALHEFGYDVPVSKINFYWLNNEESSYGKNSKAAIGKYPFAFVP